MSVLLAGGHTSAWIFKQLHGCATRPLLHAWCAGKDRLGRVYFKEVVTSAYLVIRLATSL